MKNVILIGIILILVSACRYEHNPETSEIKSFEKINQLEWLEGSWTNITEKSQSFERWNRKNDSTLTSYSHTTVGNDTVFIEMVTIQQNDNEVFFTVVVPDQNNADAVTFKMISSENGIFIFENKTHDFPTRITYSNPQKDSIHAWIEGTVKGAFRKVDFGFKRE